MKKVAKIDIHVHPSISPPVPQPSGARFTTPEELRSMYDQIGVEKGVVLPLVAPECANHLITNDEAFRMAQKYPETLYWFCNIDPRWATNSPGADFSVFLNHYKSLGARGVGELTTNLHFDDPLVWNLFAHCESTNMPVIFHIGNQGGDYGLIDELGLPRLEKSLRRFPKLRFLGHSQKFWAEISADATEDSRRGYPTGPVTPGRVVELMRRYENLCGDLSAGSGYNAVSRDPAFGYAFLEEFQDRLYYGTDICDPRNITNSMLKLSAFLDEGAEKGLLSQAAYEKISRGNALALMEG